MLFTTTMLQYVVSKQPTLVFSGHVPTHPLDAPEPPDSPTPSELEQHSRAFDDWKRKADEFAFYCSCIFLPQPDLGAHSNSEPTSMDWTTMTQQIQNMELNSRLIDRLRIAHLTRFSHGTRGNYKARTINRH